MVATVDDDMYEVIDLEFFFQLAISIASLGFG